MNLPIQDIIFLGFAAALIIAAIAVIVVRNPIHSVLCLVFCFFCASALWLLLEAEFIGLVLIFVYVGAVMTLFLFVVMMLNIDVAPLRESFVRYLPLGALVLLIFAGILCAAIAHYQANVVPFIPEASNIKALGMQLFTTYLFPFEIAGVLLLVAMIGAISLAFYGRKIDVKTQSISQQHQANKSTRLKIMKDEGTPS